MALNIRNKETCRLAREVAELTGDTLPLQVQLQSHCASDWNGVDNFRELIASPVSFMRSVNAVPTF